MTKTSCFPPPLLSLITRGWNWPCVLQNKMSFFKLAPADWQKRQERQTLDTLTEVLTWQTFLHNCWCIFGRCISTRKAWPWIVLLTKDRKHQTFWDPCFSSASKSVRAIYIRAARRQWAVFITFYFAGQGATHFPQYRLYRVSQTDVLLLLDRPLLPGGVQSRQKL